MLDALAQSLIFATLLAVAFVPLERLFAARSPSRRRRATDIAFATAGQFLARVGSLLLVGWALAGVDAISVQRAIGSGIESASLRTALQLGGGLLVFELGGYAYHRLAHAVPVLWRFHRVHHSSRDMDWLAAFRQHPIEIIAMTLLQNAPLVWLGIPLGSHATVIALLRLHTVFVHSNLRIPEGFWCSLIAVPRFHHRHHQEAGRVVNYASLLPWLDRAFGSHSAARAEHFGVDTPMPDSFTDLMLHPFTSGVGQAAVGLGSQQLQQPQ